VIYLETPHRFPVDVEVLPLSYFYDPKSITYLCVKKRKKKKEEKKAPIRTWTT
jgi:hypothetical protein